MKHFVAVVVVVVVVVNVSTINTAVSYSAVSHVVPADLRPRLDVTSSRKANRCHLDGGDEVS